ERHDADHARLPDLAGTTAADGGVIERASAEALATQGVVPGTEAYGQAMIQVQATRGHSKLAIFRAVFSDQGHAQAASHSFERAYDSVVGRIADLPDLIPRIGLPTGAAVPAPR